MLVTIHYIKTVVMDTDTNEIVSFTESVKSENGNELSLGVTSTPKKVKVKEAGIIQDNGKIKLDQGKLILTPSVAEQLNLNVGERVAINYLSVGETFSPVISKSGIYGGESSGNKLTKSLTVSFKGKPNEMLSQYGKEFKLVKLDSLPEHAFLLQDPDFKGIEDIPESELLEIKDNGCDLDIDDPFTDYSSETLQDSENDIIFNFNFDNI